MLCCSVTILILRCGGGGPGQSMPSAAFGGHRGKSTSTIIVAAAIFCFSRTSFARRVASRRWAAAARRLLAASRWSLRAFFDALNALAKVNCQINSSRERKQGGQNGVWKESGGMGRRGGGIAQPTRQGCTRRYANQEIESCFEARRELLQLDLGLWSWFFVCGLW